jgi:hypothetical protein
LDDCFSVRNFPGILIAINQISIEKSQTTVTRRTEKPRAGFHRRGLSLRFQLMAVLNPIFSFFNCPKPTLIEPIYRDGVDAAALGRNLKRPSRPATGGYYLSDADAGNCTPRPTIARMLADDLPPYGAPIELQWE